MADKKEEEKKKEKEKIKSKKVSTLGDPVVRVFE